MRKLSTREKGLVVVLIVPVVLYFVIGKERLGLGESAKPDTPLSGPSGEPPLVRLDLLAQGAADFDPKARNLFQYYVAPKPVVRTRPPPPPKVRVNPPPPPPKRDRNAKREPRPPSPDFKYLGFLGPKEGKIAVFDGGEDLILAKVGDVVKTQFKVVEFKYETVVMGFTEERFDGKTTELKMTAK